MNMPNFKLDEQAVRRAFTERARLDKVPFWQVAPEQIHRDLFGVEMTEVAVRFIKDVQTAMIKELIRAEIERMTVETPCDLTDIDPGHVHIGNDWGRFRSLAWDVLYEMLVEESQARRAE